MYSFRPLCQLVYVSMTDAHRRHRGRNFYILQSIQYREHQSFPSRASLQV